MKITMTLLVRNEEDILEDNIRFHHSQGVDSFIVMDNRSDDGTRDIVRALSKELEIDYIYQADDDYDQAAWVTGMARRAFLDHRATWVINNDADEFWVTNHGTLSEYLASVPLECSTIHVRRHNAVLQYNGPGRTRAAAHPRHSTFFETSSVNNLGFPIRDKCIHRASEAIHVSQGNHEVIGSGGLEAQAGGAIKILHYPYRTLDHYRNKISLGGAAYARNNKVSENVGYTWREHYALIETDAIDAFWRTLAKTETHVLIGMSEDDLFEDHTVAEFLRRHDNDRRVRQLSSLLCELKYRTRNLTTDFIREQSALISSFAPEVRKSRPLYYNLPFCIRGANKQNEEVSRLASLATQQNICDLLPSLRDAFSLFPRNDHFENFLAGILELNFPEGVKRIRRDCNGKRVILHLSCVSRLDLARASVASFSNDPSFHHIVVVGVSTAGEENSVPLALNYDGEVLAVPIPDDYENLHRKVFYALTLLHLTAKPSLVIKLDDSLHLSDEGRFDAALSALEAEDVEYAGRAVGTECHHMQWHGWHLAKCADGVLETRGYQYPLPRRYAAGGYAYVLGASAIAACAYMYLAMKEFFALGAVGLEDAYVGHAMYARGIELHDVSSEQNILAFPGLFSVETLVTDDNGRVSRIHSSAGTP